MLINTVGRTGSGKTLYQNYQVYTECTRIMRKDKKEPWLYRARFWLPLIGNVYFFKWLLGTWYSYYDVIGMNSEFNDGRGNACFYDREIKSWVGTGCIVGVNDLPDVYEAVNMFLHLDESGTRFNNRDWDKMPEGYIDFLTTHRHNVTGHNKRFDIVLYTQHNDLVDVTLRRLATQIYLIRPLFKYPKNPTRPKWYNRLPAIRIWIYTKHEILEGKPFQELDVDGIPIPIDKEHALEALDFWTWFYFGKKYTNTYNTHGVVEHYKRSKTPVSQKVGKLPLL